MIFFWSISTTEVEVRAQAKLHTLKHNGVLAEGKITFIPLYNFLALPDLFRKVFI